MGINSFIVAVLLLPGRQLLQQSSPSHPGNVIFNQRTVRYYRPASGDAFSPPNGSRASKPRFDLPSAVMKR